MVPAEASGSFSMEGHAVGTVDNPLTIQIRQIVGYDAITSVVEDGTGALDLRLSEAPSAEAQARLQMLAEEQGATFRYHFGDSYVEARPPDSA